MTAPKKAVTKRIAAGAYQALREALPIVFHYKRPYENYLRLALRDHPELLAGLNFKDLKRHVADKLVDRLAEGEHRYQQVTLQLMIEVGSMEHFPDLEKLEDAELRIAEARKAVAELRRWTDRYANTITEQERMKAERAVAAQQAEATRRFADELEALRQRFIEMVAMSDPHKRGYAFQDLLDKLFLLFDMEPRVSYSLEHEQIDGSLSFDTDDYIVEARWRKKPADPTDADRFAAKVQRKGKNALGLFMSIHGFTTGVFDLYSRSTPFLAIDGADLMCVLEQRVRLDDLLRRKKRYANETGHCYFPAQRILNG